MDHPAVLVVVVIQIRNELVPEMSNCHQLCIVLYSKNRKFKIFTTYYIYFYNDKYFILVCVFCQINK